MAVTKHYLWAVGGGGKGCFRHLDFRKFDFEIMKKCMFFAPPIVLVWTQLETKHHVATPLPPGAGEKNER